MNKDLRDTLVIARREFLERARSKWFVAITLLGPIGMVAVILIPALLAIRSTAVKIDIVDQTGVIGQQIHDVLAAAGWKPEIVDPKTPDDVEMARIRDKKINGFLTIPGDALGDGVIRYRGDNGSSDRVRGTLSAVIGEVVRGERGKRAGIPPDKLAALIKQPGFEIQQTDGKAEASSGVASFWLGYILAYVLFLVIMLYAVGVMRSVVLEKTSRVMELMVATVKTRSLMSGKILGVGAAGFVQFGTWLAMGAITLAYREEILLALGARSGGPALPALAFAEILVSLLYFLFGYFFYAAMYAAVGAMVSSEQDTQQVQMPIMMLLIIGFACVTIVGGDPRGSTATVVTMLPFWSALLMPMRYLLGGASGVEVAISLGILVLSTVLAVRASAKIYRVGVLMYGKRPSLRELIRWLRY
jgi:ABC-2 type transport system permease protein